MGLSAGELLRRARERSGLSQRELARRAETAQSVVARVESGRTSPTVETLERLLGAAGYEVDARLEPAGAAAAMLADVGRILALSPEERLAEVANVSRFVTAARRV